MIVIPELQLKTFVDVNIPSAKSLFSRFGGMLYANGSKASDDFETPCNDIDRMQKVDIYAKASQIQQEDLPEK